jgi:hypothetical protein
MLEPDFLLLKHPDLQLDSSMILLLEIKLVGNPLAPCNVIGRDLGPTGQNVLPRLPKE